MISLTATGPTPSAAAPWRSPERYWGALDRATAHLPAPLATLELDALRYNTHDMLRRAGGVPIRVASKSLRCRELLLSLLELPGYRGVLAFTLAEALWLAEDVDDIVVGYPSVDVSALRALAADDRARERVTLMVDAVEQLDLITAALGPGHPEIRVCIELDVAWDAPGPLGRIGVWRSPISSAADAAGFARVIARRPGFRLVGLMGYEAQIAGVADAVPGRAANSALMRWVKRTSTPLVHERRQETVAAVRAVTELEFVNGGGTGSLESTGADPSVTEIAAGSGILAGHFFDGYEAFSPAPAAAFALDVVRKPTPERATILGGGWVASGPPGDDRLPRIEYPLGLSMAAREMAGEVQTPVSGMAAKALRPGDRVWLRHTKSGELGERINTFQIVSEGEVVGETPSYRGEGKAFL